MLSRTDLNSVHLETYHKAPSCVESKKRRGYGHDKYTSIDTFYIVRLEKKGRDAESAQHGLAIFVTEKLLYSIAFKFQMKTDLFRHGLD